MPAAVRGGYDTVIIGAGISGLVCGCYLAKAGMKVLITEQHFQPGGYCTSFKRKGFTFDAAAHSFGSYHEGRIARKIFEELGLDQVLNINRYEPTDIIIAPGSRINFWSDAARTVEELQAAFPHEAKGIQDFFQFLMHSRPFDYAALRKKTYRELLSLYFTDEKLKSLLSLPVLGVSGLPSSVISAFYAVVLFIEFFIDGGYYPDGSMQALPDALARIFRDLGGELRLTCSADKIRVKSNRVQGVVLRKEGFVESKYVVSCCDARQTYTRLLAGGAVSKEFLSGLRQMKPSTSVFIAYLGLDGHFRELSMPGVSYWIMPHYDIQNMCDSGTGKDINYSTAFLMHVSPNGRSLMASVFAPFKHRQFWVKNKAQYLDKFIERIESVFPGLSRHILYKEAATPYTLYRYTLNFKGAAYGWASMPSQLLKSGFAQKTSIENLYLSGHWTTQAQGIAGVSYVARETARMILKKVKQRQNFDIMSGILSG